MVAGIYPNRKNLRCKLCKNSRNQEHLCGQGGTHLQTGDGQQTGDEGELNMDGDGQSGQEGCNDRHGGPQGQQLQGEGRVETGNARMTTTGVPLVNAALGVPDELQRNQGATPETSVFSNPPFRRHSPSVESLWVLKHSVPGWLLQDC